MAKKKTAAPPAPAKKRWSVSVPFTGYVVVEVEADDEKSAIAVAMESDLDINDCDACEFHEQIVGGNVFYGVQNEAEAEEIKPYALGECRMFSIGFIPS